MRSDQRVSHIFIHMCVTGQFGHQGVFLSNKYGLVTIRSVLVSAEEPRASESFMDTSIRIDVSTMSIIPVFSQFAMCMN